MRSNVSRCIALGLSALATAAAVACGIEEPGTDVFRWRLTPAEARAGFGQLVNFQVTIDTKSNINSNVELAQGAVPEGFTVTMPTTMASTQQTADGTIYLSPALEAGTYQVEIQAREAGAEFTANSIQITVTGPGEGADFSVEIDPEAVTLEVETARTFTFYVRPLNGFSGSVALALTGLPDDLTTQGLTPSTLDFPPGSGGGQGGTFVVSYTPVPPVASPVQLVLTASSASIVHSRTYTLTLPSPVGSP
jgi:hypothetical protein